MARQGRSAGQVAQSLGVSVRTLHHYDEIGLVTPATRTAAGYRLYHRADIERLQTVVVYRRLGFSLDEICRILAEPSSLLGHLERQRDVVRDRLDQMRALLVAIDNALEREMNQQPATEADLKELFGQNYRDEMYLDEAEARWGSTPQWKQSQERTARYTKEDWAEIKAEGEAVEQAFADAKRAGEPASGKAAMDAAEAHRMHITTRYYDVDHAFHRNLGAMYVGDERFATYYNDIEPGLAEYVRDAIEANARRSGA